MTLAEWPRRVRALGQFRVSDPAIPLLSKVDEHHLRTVLRARAGEEVVITDGLGSWSLCEVHDHELVRVSEVQRDPGAPETVLYLAPLKGDRSEWAVAKATELGISRIVPLMSARLAVKFKGDVREKVLRRWRRIADESCGQCRRTHAVIVDDPVSVGDLGPDVAVADFDGDGDWTGVRAVAIGPEGGWAPDEVVASRRRLSLGSTVLRAETAGVVAASLMAFGSGGWGFHLTGEHDG